MAFTIPVTLSHPPEECGDCCCCESCSTGHYQQYTATFVSSVDGVTPINWVDPSFCTTSCNYFDKNPVTLTKTVDPYYVGIHTEFPTCIWVDDDYVPAPVGGPIINCDSALGAGPRVFTPWTMTTTTGFPGGFILFADTFGSNPNDAMFDLTPSSPDPVVELCGLPPGSHNYSNTFIIGADFGGGSPQCTLLTTAVRVVIAPVLGTWKSCGDDDPNPVMGSMSDKVLNKIRNKQRIVQLRNTSKAHVFKQLDPVLVQDHKKTLKRELPCIHLNPSVVEYCTSTDPESRKWRDVHICECSCESHGHDKDGDRLVTRGRDCSNCQHYKAA
jgi:hypothetical protein